MKRYILLILAAVAVTACVESNINELQANRGDGKAVETITVGFENDETRIAVYSGKTCWQGGDITTVFPRTADNQMWEFMGEFGDRTGNLQYYSGETGPQVMDNIVVVYPYNNLTTLDVEKQTVQTLFYNNTSNVEDAFSGCFMVASGDDDNFTLKNVTGWLKFSLTGDGQRLSHVILRGNNGEQIAGNIEIDVNSAEAWFVEGEMSPYEEYGDGAYTGYGYYSDTTVSDRVATLSSTPIEVHFSLIPQTFTKGITIEVYCEGYEPFVVSTSDAVTIKRNHIQPMDAVEFDAPVGEEQLLVLLNAMKHSLLQTSANGYEHTDFGYHAIGVYNDHACKLIACNGWMFGYPDTYNRFQSASYGRGYGPDAGLAAQVWQLYYRAINKCNFIIGLAADNESLAVLRGLAKSYRAMLYLDLARMYECLPANTDNSPDYESGQMAVAGLTVPIVDENTTEEQAMNNPRATREEMFLFILNDLADAESSLAAYAPTAGELSLPVVYGLYARAYLWLGGFEDGLNGELPEGSAAYTLAAEYARKAINSFGGAVMYEYEWTDPYVGFTTMASSWMWGLIQTNETMINNLFQFTAHMSPEAAYGYGPFVMPGVASATYERLADTDFRKKVIKGPETSYEEFAPYTTIDEYEFYYNFVSFVNFKFRPANGERNDYALACAVTLPLMRCEEMYFIEMEAIAHAQGEAAAKAKLEEFMAYRDDNYVCPETDIVEEIIFQKGVEFWGEGILMYDMKRLDMGVDSAYSSYNYYEYARFCTDGRIPWWTYCIPISAMSTNMALINNPDPSQSLNPIY
jgi:hypothetical protein